MQVRATITGRCERLELASTCLGAYLLFESGACATAPAAGRPDLHRPAQLAPKLIAPDGARWRPHPSATNRATLLRHGRSRAPARSPEPAPATRAHIDRSIVAPSGRTTATPPAPATNRGGGGGAGETIAFERAPLR